MAAQFENQLVGTRNLKTFCCFNSSNVSVFDCEEDIIWDFFFSQISFEIYAENT